MKKIIVLLLALLLLVSCNQNKDQQATKDNKETGSSQKDTKTKIDLEKPFVLSYSVDLKNLAPLADVSAASKMILRNMHESIYKYKTNGEIYPSIAKKVDYSLEDPYIKVQIELNKGVKFHNGKELTAKDVEYSYKRLAGLIPEIPAEEITGAGYWQNLLNGKPEDGFTKGKIEIKDDYNLTVYVDDNYGILTTMYTFADGLLVPSDVSESQQKTNPVGCGPYKFVSYAQGNTLKLTRFDDYYGEKPEIKNVEFVKYADATTLPLAFESGDIDLLALTNDTYDKIAANKDLYIHHGLSNDVRGMNMNMRPGKLFENKDLRLAVVHAINRDRLNESLTNKRGKPLYSHMSPFLDTYYNDQLKDIYPYDVEKAKEYLKKAGKENGFDVTLKTVAENVIEQDMAVLIKEDLAKIGINVKIDPIAWDTYFKEVYRGFDYDLTILNIVGYPDPSRVLSRYASNAKGNLSGYQNKEVDALLKEALQTEDQKGLAVTNYKKIQEYLTKDAIAFYTIDPGVQTALSKNYEGYQNYPFAFTDISLIKYKK